MRDRVSVIIPVYNAGKVLGKGIDSVLAQTYQNYEIILVNDGSTDDSLSKCEDYAQKYSYITVINKKNEGAGAARNTGLRAATGEYVYFMDCDDWIESKLLETLVSESGSILDDTIAICSHYCEDINGKNQSIWNVKSEQLEWDSNNIPKCIASMIQSGVFNYLWDRLYKKRIIDRYHIEFDNSFTTGEDLDFNIQYFHHVLKCNMVEPPLYHYVKNGTNSLCARYKENLYEIVQRLCLESRKLYEYYGMFSNEQYRQIYERAVVSHFMSCVPNMYRKNAGLNRKARCEKLRQLMDNDELYSCCSRYEADDLLSKLFVSCILSKNPNKAGILYSLAFYIRNECEFIYKAIRRKNNGMSSN